MRIYFTSKSVPYKFYIRERGEAGHAGVEGKAVPGIDTSTTVQFPAAREEKNLLTIETDVLRCCVLQFSTCPIHITTMGLLSILKKVCYSKAYDINKHSSYWLNTIFNLNYYDELMAVPVLSSSY